ncbi:MAG: hypothetical protein JWL59_4489 [Chthoniobacteraceae bacterium]|nr:hypothetical protein [Chthoniobacteraceae bacterium]
MRFDALRLFFGGRRFLCHLVRMQNTMPCVGLIVLAGCLSFVIAPDDEVSPGEQLSGSTGSGLPTIVIDPGHGGRDEGAKSHGLVEKELTLDVALRVEKMLQEVGFPTVMTRREDVHVGLADRAAIANGVDRSVFVSIHFNQSPYSSASGVETFYASEKVPPESAWTWVGFFNKPPMPEDNGENLAGYVQLAMVERMEATNRGIKGRALYVVRHVRAPAVLVEGGFISNAFDAQLLSGPAYRDRLAASITEGLLRFQKSKPRPPQPTRLAKVQ